MNLMVTFCSDKNLRKNYFRFRFRLVQMDIKRNRITHWCNEIDLVTAGNEVGARLCFYMCLWFCPQLMAAAETRMVGKRPVRILLECFLVRTCFHLGTPWFLDFDRQINDGCPQVRKSWIWFHIEMQWHKWTSGGSNFFLFWCSLWQKKLPYKKTFQ